MTPKFSRTVASVCTLAILGLPAAQAQTMTIADIRLEGLQRVAASSVFGLLRVNVGDQVTQDDLASIIRDVFASEYFSDIQVLTEDNVLIIRVKERPTISEINVEGNKLIPTEALAPLIQQFITEYFLDNETTAAQADFLAEAEVYRGDFRAGERFINDLRAVTGEDVRRVAQTWMKQLRFTYLGNPAIVNRFTMLSF